MLTLNKDVILQIGYLLTDKEKTIVTMTSIAMNKLKHVFRYYRKMATCKISHLSYFDNLP